MITFHRRPDGGLKAKYYLTPEQEAETARDLEEYEAELKAQSEAPVQEQKSEHVLIRRSPSETT